MSAEVLVIAGLVAIFLLGFGYLLGMFFATLWFSAVDFFARRSYRRRR